jgi:peptidyl-dipeptidase A
MKIINKKIVASLCGLLLTGHSVVKSPVAMAAPTAADAKAFIDKAEKQLAKLSKNRFRALWVQDTFITKDSQEIAASAVEAFMAATVNLANEAKAFSDVKLNDETRRKLNLLKLSLLLPAPSDPAKINELSKLNSKLPGMYGKAKYCRPSGECLFEGDMSKIIGNSRNADELLEVWKGWRLVSPPMRKDYARMMELANEGAREFGYADLGAYWRSKYDMTADEFSQDLERVFGQVKPLYESLQCHVRAKLGETYGTDIVNQKEAIPAHLTGNMWAQDWANVYDLVAPQKVKASYDLTSIIKEKGMTEKDMVKSAEDFFVSLGMGKLPESFWERSQFTKPQDRDVVCHASAEDIDGVEDLRIKMCIQRNAEDFKVIHHELGHLYYFRAYQNHSHLFKDSANGGFHEAIGDAIALSITPKYLKEIGLLEKIPGAEEDIPALLRMALDKVAFLPWGLLVDKWRWQVASGEVKPENYNAAWWKLREQYQGIKAPEHRGEEHFDAGAKFHVPGSVSYTRYFVADIMQFQFHKALCDIAGNDAALHRCSIYGNQKAGKKLNDMLKMGMSQPWPEALKAMNGQTQMDATAMLEYFAPLQKWLDNENKGRTCGWQNRN